MQLSNLLFIIGSTVSLKGNSTIKFSVKLRTTAWDIITLLSTSGGAGSSPPACTLGRALRGAAVSVAFVLLAGAGAETVPGVLNTLCRAF